MGTMSIADVFAPAIEYAEKGYPIDPMLAQSIDRGKTNLGKYPTTAKIFLPNGQPLKAGELLKKPDYRATLRKLVDAEKQALAKKATRLAGDQGRRSIVSTRETSRRSSSGFFKENGGLLTAADLAAYEPQWTEPLQNRLSRLRRLQQPVDVARRLRSADAGESRRALRSRLVRIGVATGDARVDRGDQGRQVRHLPLRRRSEVHRDSHCRDAVEAIRAARSGLIDMSKGRQVSRSGRA
jgi:hypothetical protein